MSQRGDQAAPPDRAHSESFFRLGSRRPTATILMILAFLGLSGFGFGALLGADVDVEPFVPDPGLDRVSGTALGSAVSGPALPESVLGLSQFQSPTGEPTPIGDPSNQPGGVPERFGPNDEGVLVVPDGWEVLTRTEDLITLGNGGGVRFAARIVRATAATPATQLVSETQARILSSNGAHLRKSVVIGLQPFGLLVTRSAVGYSALRTDAQGLSSVGGNILAYVRDDGVALIVNPEVTPAAHWEARIADWFPLWLSVVSNFAGASPAA